MISVILQRQENIVEELLTTETNYVDDLQMVLNGYMDKMKLSDMKVAVKTDLIFGNLEEIFEFHSQNLLPQLESCGLNSQLIARTFLEYGQQLARIYCRYFIILKVQKLYS